MKVKASSYFTNLPLSSSVSANDETPFTFLSLSQNFLGLDNKTISIPCFRILANFTTEVCTVCVCTRDYENSFPPCFLLPLFLSSLPLFSFFILLYHYFPFLSSFTISLIFPCLHVSLSPPSPLSSDTLTHSYSFLPLLIASLPLPTPSLSLI